LEVDFGNYDGFIEFVVDTDSGVCTIDRNISKEGIKALNETLKLYNRMDNGKQINADSAECYSVFRGGSGMSSFG